MRLRLGVIADDFTGATDVANNLVRAGLRVVQTIGVPDAEAQRAAAEADAAVVALKSRTAPVAEAESQSLAAGRWLLGHGARQLYFKVCSTFDSTARGNIGPVAEALMQLAPPPAGTCVPVTPAFPTNGRTVFKGHLFVGDLLLSDSPMRHHPLTPMTDANLVRVLQAQLARQRVGLVDFAVVSEGAGSIRRRCAEISAAGSRLAIVDSVDDAALARLAEACAAWPLVVAGSGLASALPACWGYAPSAEAAALPRAGGAAAIVSGSCSAQSNAQVADFVAAGGAMFPIDPMCLARDGDDAVGEALDWATARMGREPVLIAATAPPEAVREVQQALGIDRAGTLVEQALARIARGLVERGVRRLVVAGGETSGACVQALGIRHLRIGPQIDPGVPWCHAPEADLHLALKSGNFGGVSFFRRAFEVLAP